MLSSHRTGTCEPVSINTCLRYNPEEQGSWGGDGGGTPRGRGVPRLIPWSFIHSGLPQGTKEDLEAKGDLQAKKHWCKQLEARHMRSHSAKGEDLQPGLLC